MSRRIGVIGLLLVVNVASAIGVVESTQKTRELFHSLQAARARRDHLDTEWAQIQLEDSAWASPDRVAQVARNRLGMVQPHDYVVLGDRP